MSGTAELIAELIIEAATVIVVAAGGGELVGEPRRAIEYLLGARDALAQSVEHVLQTYAGRGHAPSQDRQLQAHRLDTVAKFVHKHAASQSERALAIITRERLQSFTRIIHLDTVPAGGLRGTAISTVH